MTNWLSLFWKTAGTGVITGAIIVLWDILRMWIQSKWLVKKIKQPTECPHCKHLSKKIEEIHNHIGANSNGSGQSYSNKT